MVRRWLRRRLPALRAGAVYAARLHLAAFYLAGAYYQWSKRLVRVRYTSLSSSRDRQASYEVRQPWGVAAVVCVCGRPGGREAAPGSALADGTATMGGSGSHGAAALLLCCLAAAQDKHSSLHNSHPARATCSACVLHPWHMCTC